MDSLLFDVFVSQMLWRVDATRYGIDGWPYVVGLTGGAILAGGAALIADGKMRWACAAVAVAAGVPAALGDRYVLSGKMQHRDKSPHT